MERLVLAPNSLPSGMLLRFFVATLNAMCHRIGNDSGNLEGISIGNQVVARNHVRGHGSNHNLEQAKGQETQERGWETSFSCLLFLQFHAHLSGCVELVIVFQHIQAREHRRRCDAPFTPDQPRRVVFDPADDVRR